VPQLAAGLALDLDDPSREIAIGSAAPMRQDSSSGENVFPSAATAGVANGFSDQAGYNRSNWFPVANVSLAAWAERPC
jgi:hypothetical protein